MRRAKSKDRQIMAQEWHSLPGVTITEAMRSGPCSCIHRNILKVQREGRVYPVNARRCVVAWLHGCEMVSFSCL